LRRESIVSEVLIPSHDSDQDKVVKQKVKKPGEWPLYMFLFFVVAVLIFIVVFMCKYLDGSVTSSPNYPERPITMIVPFSAGGSLDLIVRSMEKLAVKHLGQPLVVTNILGGAGASGWNELLRAKPDGYSLSIVTASVLLHPHYGPTRYHYPSAMDWEDQDML
jgi:tripartite-type tricarboxylate transporter receptor subunit TctC